MIRSGTRSTQRKPTNENATSRLPKACGEFSASTHRFENPCRKGVICEVFEDTHKQEIRREFTRKKTAKHTVLDREIEHWEKKESTKRVFRLEVGDMVLFNTAAVHRPIYHRRDSQLDCKSLLLRSTASNCPRQISTSLLRIGVLGSWSPSCLSI